MIMSRKLIHKNGTLKKEENWQVSEYLEKLNCFRFHCRQWQAVVMQSKETVKP